MIYSIRCETPTGNLYTIALQLERNRRRRGGERVLYSNTLHSSLDEPEEDEESFLKRTLNRLLFGFPLLLLLLDVDDDNSDVSTGEVCCCCCCCVILGLVVLVQYTLLSSVSIIV